MAFAVDMGIPVVGFWVTLPIGIEMESTTQPSPPSHVPYFMSGFSDRMSFWQRLQNVFLKTYHNIMLFHSSFILDRIIKTYIPHSPSSHEMLMNISGCLVNSHSVFEVAMPRVPTFVNILGNMIQKELQPLPKVQMISQERHKCSNQVISEYCPIY
jgi:glucuronosyltransferase